MEKIKSEFIESEKAIQKMQLKEQGKYELLKKKASRAEQQIKRYMEIEDEIKNQYLKLSLLTKQVNQKVEELKEIPKK